MSFESNKKLKKLGVTAHYWSYKHQFVEEWKLLKHINNRPRSKLLIREKIIYKNKKMSINFGTNTPVQQLFEIIDGSTMVERWGLGFLVY